MRREGYRESTCYYAVRALKRVDRRCNVLEPESVRRLLANCDWNEGGKQRITEEVDRFYRYEGIKWDRPRYEKVDLLPHIPKEEYVNALVAGLPSNAIGTFCLLLKETGCRPGEAWHADWTHIDFDRNMIVIRPEKGSKSRELRISNNLIARLNLLPKDRKYVFHDGTKDPIQGMKDFTRAFQKQRRQLALRLANPNVQQISFRSLRHYMGTMLYHKTKDIVFVQRTLGHKSISNTLRYVRLIDFPEDEYTSKVAKTVKEAQELVEAGFEFVCDVEGFKLFRKRK